MNRIVKICGLIACLLLAGAVHAQGVPVASIFVGYSYLNTDLNSSSRASLNGWNASFEGRVLPFLGIVADVSGQYGSTDETFCVTPVGMSPTCTTNSVGVHQQNYLFGPRVSVSVGKFRPFAHALVGLSHVAGGPPLGSDTSLSDAVGGGLDYRLVRFVSARLQVDFLHTRLFGAGQNDVRISTGLVLRF
jgi:hypothetical protein